MGTFRIECTDLEWITDSPWAEDDLCLHGKVRAVIGDTLIEDSGTVSATALYLLKSLTRNHVIDAEIQMIPCCGHTFLYNADLTEVDISGCPYGTDWTVEHGEGGVKIITREGQETFVSMAEYRREVFRFADRVEAFYAAWPEKKPCDDFTRNGYTAFWNEWRQRRGKNRSDILNDV